MAVQGLQPVSSGYVLTDSGRAWLLQLGFEPPEPNSKWRCACPLLDWSEQRDHLAGELADRLYLHLVAQGVVRREAGRGRGGDEGRGVGADAPDSKVGDT